MYRAEQFHHQFIPETPHKRRCREAAPGDLFGGDKLTYAAKVRNGFVPRVRREVWRKLKGLEITTCPFANLSEKKRTQFSLTREEMKNCVWVRPELIAQIEFIEWTPGGHLRHSKFVGLRDDKDPGEIVREQ